MSIDPKNLPDGTVVEVSSAGWHYGNQIGTIRRKGENIGFDVNWSSGTSWESLTLKPSLAVVRAFEALPDPDADLIERMAQTIADNLACEGVGTVSPLYRELATKALAVVREADAR